MKKHIYITAVALGLLTLAGCYQPKKRVAPPPSPPVDYGPSQVEGTYQAPQTDAAPKSSRSPDYLDIADTEQITIEQVTREDAIPAMDYINDRIFEYSRKLDRWKTLDNQSLIMDVSQEDTEQMVRCFRDLQKVLNGYTSIRENVLKSNLSGGGSPISQASVRELQRSDIAFLESPCGKLLAKSGDQAAGWEKREAGADLAQLEALIHRYGTNREYEEVVQVWLQIPQSQIDRVDLSSKLMYANALMYLHQEEVAAGIYQQIVDQMSASKEQSTDLISLRKMLADLYTASGDYQAAEAQYTKISDDYLLVGQIEEWSRLQLSILDRSLQGSPELTEYSSLLRNYLGYIPDKDGYAIAWQAEEFLNNYPYSAVSSNVDIIKTGAMQKADEWFAGIYAEADELVAEKKFQEAINLLAIVPRDIISEQHKMELQARSDELILADAVERETVKLARVQELQRQWNSGMLLVRAERFDEAIDLFTEMIETEYGPKAEAKITEISLLAARADRRKAADVFNRYTKTTDIESKKKLLIESRRLLKDILVKYPDVEIAGKVRGNIERVEQEMNRIDPTLLSIADQGSAYSLDEGNDPFDIMVEQQPNGAVMPPIVEKPIE